MAQCPFMLLSVLYLHHEAHIAAVSSWRRGAAVVRQQYFNGSTDLWMVCHRGENDLGQPQNHCSLHLDGSSHTGPHFPPSQSVQHSQCLQKPAPAWITTCQDVACLSVSLSAHSNTPAHKHRRTCKHQHTSSMCLVEWPDKKTWHYLFSVSVYLCMRIHTRSC